MRAMLRIFGVIGIATGTASVATWLDRGSTVPLASIAILLIGIVAYLIGEIAEAEANY